MSMSRKINYHGSTLVDKIFVRCQLAKHLPFTLWAVSELNYWISLSTKMSKNLLPQIFYWLTSLGYTLIAFNAIEANQKKKKTDIFIYKVAATYFVILFIYFL